jgi:hypothetical protein
LFATQRGLTSAGLNFSQHCGASDLRGSFQTLAQQTKFFIRQQKSRILSDKKPTSKMKWVFLSSGLRFDLFSRLRCETFEAVSEPEA